MNAARLVSVLILLVLALTACSTRSVESELSRCAFPDSPRTPGPAFLCDATIPGFPFTVLRSSEPSDISVSERIELTLNDQLEQWSEQWSQQWFSSESERLAAQQYLLPWLVEQSRVVRSRVSPKGYLWLLIGLPVTLDEIEQQTRLALAPAVN